MCSVGDDVFETEATKNMPVKEKFNISSNKCNKCREEAPVIVLRNKDTYCKDCFLVGTNHKFKALLGKHKLIRPNDKILIFHKIGHPSTALLHFLRVGLDLNTPKKLRFEPIILFIEDNVNYSMETRKDILNKIQIEIESFNFKSHFVSFVDYISNKCETVNIFEMAAELKISEEDKLKINEYFKPGANKTNKNDLLHIARRKLLIDIAKNFQCKFVFTPELSIDVASQLISDVSLGRGSHVPIDTGFCDDRDLDVKILRPLRLFDIKELAFYNKFNNLEPLALKETPVNPYSSVQDLMKKFVKDLQTNYPATVTTILKTGDKLAMKENTGRQCKMCKAVIFENSMDLTSDNSTNFSHWISTQKFDPQLSSQEKYQNLLDGYEENVNKDFCYSCNKIFIFVN